MRCPLVLALALVAHAAQAAPGSDDDATQRRSIRGAPVPLAVESDELRRLRALEEESFPRSGAPLDASERRSLPLGLGPDAIPAALRSPVTGHAPSPTVEATVPWLLRLQASDL